MNGIVILTIVVGLPATAYLVYKLIQGVDAYFNKTKSENIFDIYANAYQASPLYYGAVGCKCKDHPRSYRQVFWDFESEPPGECFKLLGVETFCVNCGAYHGLLNNRRIEKEAYTSQEDKNC